MGEFSPAWLQLRETVDARSRNKAVAKAAHDAFGHRNAVRVIDVGCGTGANLRATAPLLGMEQHWTLVDYDARLLGHAAAILGAWADTAAAASDRMSLTKDGRTITVVFRMADLATDLEGVLGDDADLVTASAFFDLASRPFIERFVGHVVRTNAAFLTVLTYDGVQSWSPPHGADTAMDLAFNAHQRSDKGFGPAAGPDASTLLEAAFHAAGYRLTSGEVPGTSGLRITRCCKT